MLNLLGQSVEMSYKSCSAMLHHLVRKSIFNCGKPNKEQCKFTDVTATEVSTSCHIMNSVHPWCSSSVRVSWMSKQWNDIQVGCRWSCGGWYTGFVASSIGDSIAHKLPQTTAKDFIIVFSVIFAEGGEHVRKDPDEGHNQVGHLCFKKMQEDIA